MTSYKKYKIDEIHIIIIMVIWMVMRTLEVKEISYKVEKERIENVVSKLKDLYGNQLEIIVENDEVKVRGDLHNYKRRERILWVLSGGKHGSDLQVS